MLLLIKKELTSNVKYLLIGLLLFVIYAFVYGANGGGLFTLCLVFCFYSISTTNLILDERYKIELLLSTLPLRRREIVLSKYLLIGVIFIGCFILYTLLVAATRALGYDKIPPLTFFSAALGLVTVSVFNGVMLPLAYKLGAQATRYVSIILFFIIFFLGAMLSKLPLSSVTVFLSSLTETGLGFLLIGAALLVNIISYSIAAPIYEKKDF